MQKKQKSKPNQAARTTNQVRIIGGLHKRRLISFIDADGLRPTPDRLRETLFNWLMGDLNDASVLDVCAGSGVLGFESISRGASSAVLIEYNSAQAKLLADNAELLKIDAQTTIKSGDCLAILPTLSQAFDVIFIDPPYAKNLWQAIIDLLFTHQLLHKNSLIYFESDREIETVLTAETLAKLSVEKSTKIGQAYAYLLTLHEDLSEEIS
ncbi:16S rRNA (guanine(966)-N(2))-methyltransferase RsmD [Moraxella sp. FZLJ2107]|uniref:16S rRNA (guanine(966)-N(2))-methyltransferase RsmD n=1 Tax=unclassified Moraxella TaxID=2685852 RepID=UPI0020C8A5FB|nr:MULTISPECIES: 16S rRNA (guanine(966)-N(2))-methyltransferase RsmD [unclassified Moraxella]UTO05849.1 16S rRNA (guanine(966)-N(2))-methyltransferase RsmD [Moraxella sp. FZLJ2107]UTO22585.1 16S rRNA (guanine(966)-N(2))-methyltransferase RsmD [Moraxella sp. FZLJ2109]